MWVFLVLLYGLFKGAREIAKKKALEKSGVMEVLFVYTLLSFLFVVPDAGNAMGLSGTQLLCVLAKSAVIFVAWICGFQAIARLPVSLYSVLDLSRVIFSTLLGVCFLGEQMRTGQSIGLVLVLCGLLLLKAPWKKKGRRRGRLGRGGGAGADELPDERRVGHDGQGADAGHEQLAAAVLVHAVSDGDVRSLPAFLAHEDPLEGHAEKRLDLADERAVRGGRPGAVPGQRHAGQSGHGDDAAQAVGRAGEHTGRIPGIP